MSAKITKQSYESMEAAGWTFAGTTSDRTMVGEIRRDYLACGYREVAFTEGDGNVLYWWRNAPRAHGLAGSATRMVREGDHYHVIPFALGGGQ